MLSSDHSKKSVKNPFAIDQHKIANINILEFMHTYFKSGNFYSAINILEKRYQANNFKISLAFSTFFYVMQNKEDVKKILSAKTIAGYQNQNFDVAHGHMLNINALPAFINGKVNPLWHSIHTCILNSVGNAKSISLLIEKHFPKFLENSTFDLDIAFESFMESFWCEFMFGAAVNVKQFSQTRAKLLAALRYCYYDNNLKNIPYIGTQACQIYGYLKKNDFTKVDTELEEYLAKADNCLFSKLRNELINDSDFPRDKINTALLDNAFVLILALDFIQNAMYETLTKVIKSDLKTTAERKAVYSEGLHDAFLFPFRTRVPQENLILEKGRVTAGTPIFINLLKTGLYHSAGPKTCAGIGVTQWIKEAIWTQLENIEFKLIATSRPQEREIFSHSKDVPISPERYTVNWHYSRDYLQKILPHYEFKGIKEFFDVLKIYEHPFLSHYVTANFVEAIKKLKLDPTKLCIATPEVRGIPTAATVADALHVPLVVIRKPGKIPGQVATKKYTNAYATESIELSMTSAIKDKNVIFIDDGIASGGTTLACCDLIKQLGGDIKGIMAVINHTYTNKIADLKHYPVVTLFDFTANAPQPSTLNATPLPSAQIIQANSLFNRTVAHNDTKLEINPQAKYVLN